MRRATWLFVALMACAPSARAEVALGGHVKTFVFQQLGAPWELALAGARLQLAARGGVGDVASFYAAVDFQLDSRLVGSDQPLRRGEGLDVFPVEIYGMISKGPIDLKIGQQFVFWGRTSWINPTDVITAWDYPNMASEIEDYRRAPLAARLQWAILGELALDAVWVPIFGPSRIGPFVAGESVGGLPVVEGAALLPSRQAKNGEFGLRLSQTISRWALDWAIAAYKGFEKMPVMVLTPRVPTGATAPDAFVLTRRYDSLWMVGADLAKAFGPVVLKGEGALKITDDWKGDDVAVRNSRIEAVAGIDYRVGDKLTLGAQYIHTTQLNYDLSAERAALEAMGAGGGFLAERHRHDVSLRIDFELMDELGGQVLSIYSITNEDAFVLAFLWWKIADALQAYLGTVTFVGRNDDTPYARQRQNSRLFAELKLSF